MVKTCSNLPRYHPPNRNATGHLAFCLQQSAVKQFKAAAKQGLWIDEKQDRALTSMKRAGANLI